MTELEKPAVFREYGERVLVNLRPEDGLVGIGLSQIGRSPHHPEPLGHIELTTNEVKVLIRLLHKCLEYHEAKKLEES